MTVNNQHSTANPKRPREHSTVNPGKPREHSTVNIRRPREHRTVNPMRRHWEKAHWESGHEDTGRKDTWREYTEREDTGQWTHRGEEEANICQGKSLVHLQNMIQIEYDRKNDLKSF